MCALKKSQFLSARSNLYSYFLISKQIIYKQECTQDGTTEEQHATGAKKNGVSDYEDLEILLLVTSLQLLSKRKIL